VGNKNGGRKLETSHFVKDLRGNETKKCKFSKIKKKKEERMLEKKEHKLSASLDFRVCPRKGSV